MIDYPTISFNIAHSNNMVVCAVGKNSLGIDIKYKYKIEFGSLSKHFFHMNEWQYINDTEPGSGLDRFYKLWTLKESYIKCTGDGFSKKLDSFFIDINKNSRIKVYDKENLEQFRKYRFYNKRYDDQYHISVCSEQDSINERGTKLDYNVVANFLDSSVATLKKRRGIM